MIQLKDIKKNILSVLKGGDILFIVPPFATAKNPVLGVHILQSLAEERGYNAEILYLNVLLASVIGMEDFEYVCYPPFERMWMMLHERLFARSAYSFPPLGKSPEYCFDEAMSVANDKKYPDVIYQSGDFNLETYFEVEKICTAFVEEVAAVIASFNYKIIGCTTRMGQTNCSVALLDRIKRINPEIITLIGGTDCKGEQAKGIASLSNSIDYIFSNESDLSFSDFLEKYSSGELPSNRIIYGTPLMDLDQLPFTEYKDFLNQTDCFLGKDAPQKVIVCYETSRGCWWGEKNRCNFCSEDNIVRQKSSQKVLSDLKRISMNPKIEGIYMCDVAMPLSYHGEIFPELLKKTGYTNIYYQSKVNLSLQDIINLKKAKVNQLTFGIEALSSGLLKLMNKGNSVGQNLQLLRNARSAGILVDWLFLWGFPGDKVEFYQKTLSILPLIRHLQPPMTCLHMILARFSPYFKKPENFHIKNIRPMAVYSMIFPENTDFDNLACWFVGDYPCEAHENPQLMEKIGKEVGLWKKLWETTNLVMIPFGKSYLIIDTRDCIGKKQHLLDYEKAKAIMTNGVYDGTEYRQWALEEKLGVIVDSSYISLITASPELLLQFERK